MDEIYRLYKEAFERIPVRPLPVPKMPPPVPPKLPRLPQPPVKPLPVPKMGPPVRPELPVLPEAKPRLAPPVAPTLPAPKLPPGPVKGGKLLNAVPAAEIRKNIRQLARGEFPAGWTERYHPTALGKAMVAAQKRVARLKAKVRMDRIVQKKNAILNKVRSVRQGLRSGIAARQARAYAATHNVNAPKVIKGVMVLSSVAYLYSALSGKKPVTRNQDTAEVIAPVVDAVPAADPIAPMMTTQVANVKYVVENMLKSGELADADRAALATYPGMLDQVGISMQTLTSPVSLDDRNSVSGYISTVRSSETVLSKAYDRLEGLQAYLAKKGNEADASRVGDLLDSISGFLTIVDEARGAMQ